jgi:hypothetical protein
VDAASVATSPHKLATNVNAFCSTSPLLPGLGAANTIVSSTEVAYPKAGLHVVSDRKVTATASLVVVRIQLNLQTAAGQTVHELQYIHLTSQSQICYTTFSTDRPRVFFPLFAKIAATIHVG